MDVGEGRPVRGCYMVEQLADLMVMEQLLNTLPVNVKIWVEEKRPKTSEKAARLADDFLRARKQTKLAKPASPEDKTAERSTRRCHTCKQTGHFARDCPQGSGRPEPGKSIERHGTVNGQEVGNIVLDTGCSQTMVHSHISYDRTCCWKRKAWW